MRRAAVVAALVGTFVVLLLLVGDRFDYLAEGDSAVLALRKYEAWAWAAAVLLICGDLVLPVPSSSVIAALGVIYGTFAGGLYGAAALLSAGALGYGVVRALGPKVAVFLAGKRELGRLQAFFERRGAWAIVLTRPFPIVPEVVVCLAGLARMRPTIFFPALAVGSIPTGFVYAAIGSGWDTQPIVAMAIAYVAPWLLLPLALYLTRTRIM
jgi:uncharacterized membrane protein YdjX (TVP38/TMEM64 family)